MDPVIIFYKYILCQITQNPAMEPIAKQPNPVDSYSPENIQCLKELIEEFIEVAEMDFNYAVEEFIYIADDVLTVADTIIIYDIILPMLNKSDSAIITSLFDKVYGPSNCGASPTPSLQYLRKQKKQHLKSLDEKSFYYDSSLC